jgi:hypothetical protein
MKLLEDIDDLLAFLEDTAHGEEGKRITEMRHRIHTELSNSHKHAVGGGEQLGNEGSAKSVSVELQCHCTKSLGVDNMNRCKVCGGI